VQACVIILQKLVIAQFGYMFTGLVNTFRKELISSAKRTQQADSFVKLKLEAWALRVGHQQVTQSRSNAQSISWLPVSVSTAVMPPLSVNALNLSLCCKLVPVNLK